MSKPRILLARNVKPGDFYMDGFVNGSPHGASFTVSEVKRSVFRSTLTLYSDADDTTGTTLSNDQLVVIERG